MKSLAFAVVLGLFCSGFATVANATPQPGKDKKAGGPNSQRPNREQLKAKLLEKFDADGDGKLSAEERAAMKEAMQRNRLAQGGNGPAGVKKGQGTATKPPSGQHRKLASGAKNKSGKSQAGPGKGGSQR